ncbi:FAD-binding domain-containing protein [Byssothecium circinans]|uniref:FAD-binding domain-containing protein n=1 Tax=Byssothecium circinans TaxID=147558 RepID=A0A6A5TD98_9PLEO|nr:FAD-binding domain-containing protein [Byssothecium circinans]
MPLKVHRYAAAALCTISLASAELWNSTWNSTCRNLPGDLSWPGPEDWAQLNASVDGRLIATVPLAAQCHGALYDDVECRSIQATWTKPEPHFQDPASIQNPYWLNNSCSPFSQDGGCVNGNIAEYSINVTNADDVAAGVKFAQEKNIRLVIKNTGHDFLGRSSGKGSLLLWTHNLKGIEFLDYRSDSYNGRAIKMGAGVQAFEAYAAAAANGLRTMGGFCPTVGLVGGYTQGAGHGPLNGEYGLAADNTLEWEVVTAEGKHLVASKEQNSDLYWALSGGGGGTYAVVLSLTTKAHPDGLVGGGTLQFTSEGIPADKYWGAVEKFNEHLPALVENKGVEMVYTLTNASFYINFLTWVGHTAEDVTALLAPITDYLSANGISYTPVITDDPTYYGHYSRYTPALPFGTYQINEIIGGRLVPYSVVENNNSALTAALRNITSDPDWTLNGVAANTTHARVGNRPGDNAVLPAWRDNLVFLNIVRVWDPASPLADLQDYEHQMTYDKVPQLERLTPGGGTYINEGDFNNPNWKVDYFGANYPQLLAIKKKYDPNDLFYAIASVGNDVWKVAGDGRLCRA